MTPEIAKRNLQKMVDMGASPTEITTYANSTGFTAQEIKAQVAPRGVTGAWEEPFLNPPMGETQLSQGKPLRKTASNIYTPVLEGGGLLAGGVGYAAGRDIARELDEFTGLTEEVPETERLKRIGKDIAVGGTITAGMRGIGRVMGITAGPVSKTFTEQNRLITETVKKHYREGIKPGVAGKKTATALNAYYEKAANTVKAIISRPDKRMGSTERLPKTVAEFSERIHKTKLKVWNEAHGKVVAGKKSGIEVDLNPVIAEMRAVGNSSNLRRANKSEADRLLSLADDWEQEPTLISPEAAETLLAEYNSLSKSWWNNPNPNDVRAALNHERIASNLRTALKKALPEGKEYLALRKEYGDLLATEKDVGHRAVVWGRRNPKGFFDLANVAGTGAFVHGLVATNPGTMAAGAAMKLGANLAKRANNPDRVIKKMFKSVDKILKKMPEKPKDFAGVPLKTKTKEPYRYNPKFEGVKSPRVSTLQPKPTTHDIPPEFITKTQRATAARKPNVARRMRAEDLKKFNKTRTEKGLPTFTEEQVESAIRAKQRVAGNKVRAFREKKGLPMGKYKKAMDVREAFGRDEITEKEAELILKHKFGYE